MVAAGYTCGMNWKPNPGKSPRTGERPLKVRFANGYESRWEYVAAQLRWSLTGSEWDVAEVARA
jgi:hypothetical protein